MKRILDQFHRIRAANAGRRAERYRSLRMEFAALFFALMAGTIAIILLANTAFLERYYNREKQDTLEETYERLNEAAKSNSIESITFGRELTRVASKDNISILVMDEESQTVRSMSPDMDTMMIRMWDNILETTNDLPDDFADQGMQDWQEDRHAPDYYIVRRLVTTDSMRVQIVLDKSTGTQFMEQWGMLSNGSYYLLRTAMESIRSSAMIANRFIILIGLAIVAAGIVISLVLADRIARPILRMTELSRRMRRLDFSAKYEGHDRNEIQTLGENMNELSATLEATISELKNANAKLQQDIERRDQSEAMQREFISNVTHELKTPIALIQGYAEGLQDGCADDPEDRNYYCGVIVDEAGKMNRMVQQFLSLSHLEFGQNNELNYENFDVTELVRGYIRTGGILASEKDIKVQVESEEPIYVWADQFYVEEVFQNYFTNAVHYCSGDKVIDIRFQQKDNKVRIGVFNTGDPIPEESIPRLWDKFYKVDKARTRSYGGSGVGLSIVKAVMELIHEDYGVKNYDNGVEFWFELPTNAV